MKRGIPPDPAKDSSKNLRSIDRARVFAWAILLLIGIASFRPATLAAQTPPTYTFVLNAKSPFSVIAIDPASHATVKTIPIASAPSYMTSSPNGKYIFVGQSFPNEVSIIDAQTLTVAAIVPVRQVTEQMVVSPDSKYLYVAGYTLQVIDIQKALANPSTSIIMDQAMPFGATVQGSYAISPDGSTLYVFVFEGSTGMIYDFNAQTYPTLGNGAFRKRFTSTIQSRQITFASFSADGTLAYMGVTDTLRSSRVMIIDVAHDAILNTATPTTNLIDLRSRPDGTSMIGLTNNGPSIMDPSSLSVLQSFNVCPLPPPFGDVKGFDFAADNRTLFVSRSASLSMVDLVSGTVSPDIVTFPSSQAAWWVAMSGPKYQFVPLPRVTLSVAPGGVHLSSVTYTWTAPSHAATYDFRYAASAITSDAAFAAATTVPIPAPSAPGAPESYNLTGLTPDTTYFVAMKVTSDLGMVGPLSNSPGVHTIDNLPPAAIADLSASAAWGSSVTLTWTATGDNGSIGQAQRYDLRYATFPLTGLASYLGATPVSNMPAPRPSGAMEAFTVAGLISDTTYYWAIRAFDEAGNVSALSNVLSLATRDIIPPGAITLAVSTATDRSISYTWIATGDNGSSGTAASYDFRYATYPILTDAYFYGAARASLSAPRPSESTETFTLSGLKGNTTYFAAVKAIDKAGNVGPLSNSPAMQTVDLIPPTAVTDLAVSLTSGTSISLAWTATGDDGLIGLASRYTLLYTTADTSFGFIVQTATPIAGVPAPQISGTHENFAVTGLTPDTTYSFALLVADKANNVSPLSNIARTRTLDIFPPAPITDLVAASGNKGQIALFWTAVGQHGTVGTAVSYAIKVATYAITNGNFDGIAPYTQSIAPAPAGGSESFTLAGLVYGATYFVAIAAVDDAGSRGAITESPSAMAGLDLIPPTPIGDLKASAAGTRSVLLTWTATGDDGKAGQAASYDLRVSSMPIGTSIDAFNAATPVAGLPRPAITGTPEQFTLSSLPSDVSLFFSIRAIDPAGNISDLSNAVSAVLPDSATLASVFGPNSVGIGSSFDLNVLVTDALGIPIPGVNAGMSVVSGASSLQNASAVTSGAGLATFHVTAAAAPEHSVFSAQVGSLAPILDEVTVLITGLTSSSNFPTTPIVLSSLGSDSKSLTAQWVSQDPIAGIKQYKAAVGATGDGTIGMWEDVTDPQNPLSLGSVFDVVSSGSRLYAFSGTSEMANVNADGSLAWTAVASPPNSVVQKQSTVIVSGKIYNVMPNGQVQFGFLDSTSGLIQGWRMTTPLPFSEVRTDFRVVALGNHIYVSGGLKALSTQVTADVFVATLNADGTIPGAGQPGSWIKTTPLPSARSRHGMAILGNLIYVTGGQDGNSNVLNSVYFAKPNPDGTVPAFGQPGTWVQIQDLPLARTNHTLETDGTYLYLIGGTDHANGDLAVSVAGVRTLPVFRAKPLSDGSIPTIGQAGSWTAVMSPPLAQGSAVARFAVQRLYSFGEAGNTINVAQATSDGILSAWQPFSSNFMLAQLSNVYGWPSDFAFTSVSSPGKKDVFIIGGLNNRIVAGSPSSLPFVSKLAIPVDNAAPPRAAFWQSMPNLPEGRADAAAVGAQGNLYVLGGITPYTNQPSDVVFGAPIGGVWSTVGTLPFPNNKHIALTTGQRVYMIGGEGYVFPNIYSAPILPNGKLGPFVFEASVSSTEKDYPFLQAIYQAGRIYFVDRGGIVSSIIASDTGVDPASMRSETRVPVSLAGGFAVTTAGGYLYIAGSDFGILSSRIGADGTLGKWASAGTFPSAHPNVSLVAVADKLFAFTPTQTSPTDAFFTGVNLSGDDVQQYTYQLDSQLSLANLALGFGLNYRFGVRAQSNSGVWSDVGVSGPIAIPAPVSTPHTTLQVGAPQVQLSFLYISSVTPLAITASPGIASISASLDGNPLSVQPGAPFNIAADGSHLLSYFGTSASGTSETPHQVAIVVSNTGPQAAFTNLAPYQIIESTSVVLQGTAYEPVTSLSGVSVSTDGGRTLVPAAIQSFDQNRVASWTSPAIALPYANAITTFAVQGINSLNESELFGVPVAIFNEPFPASMQVDVTPRINLPGEPINVTVSLTDPFGRPLDYRNGRIRVEATFNAQIIQPSTSSADSVFAKPVAYQDATGVIQNTLTLPGLSVNQLNQIAAQRTQAQVQSEADAMIASRKSQITQQANDLANNLYNTTFLSDSQIQARVQSFITDQIAQLQTDVTNFVQSEYTRLLPTISQQVFNELGNKQAEVIQVTITVSTSQPLLDYPLPGVLVATATVLSVPQLVALTGLPTQDNGRSPSPFTLGDNSAYSSQGPAWGRAMHPTDTAGFAVARRQVLATNPQLYSPDINLSPVIRTIYRPIVAPLIESFERDPNSAMLSVAFGFATSYVTGIMTGGILSVDPLTGNISVGFPIDSVKVGVGGLSLGSLGFSDATLFPSKNPNPLSLTKLSYQVGFQSAANGQTGLPSGLEDFMKGASMGYSANSGFNFAFNKNWDGLNLGVGTGGWSVAANANGLDMSRGLGTVMGKVGLNNSGGAFLSGDWNGRTQFQPKGLINTWMAAQTAGTWQQAGGSKYRFGFGQLGNLFSGISGYAKGAIDFFQGIGNGYNIDFSGIKPNISMPGVGRLPGGLGDFPKIPLPQVPSTPSNPMDGLMCQAIPRPSLAPPGGGPPMGLAALPLGTAASNRWGNFRKSDNVNRAVATTSGFSSFPINTGTGNLLYMVEDFLIPGRSLFIQDVRAYNSLSAYRNGPLGYGWTFNYAISLSTSADGSVLALLGDGSTRRYLSTSSGTYTAPPGTFAQLVQNTDGSYTMTHKHGTQYIFSAIGQLSRIVDKNGNTITLSYQNGQLSAITDPSGRSLTFVEDSQGHITQVTDPLGRVTRYQYDASGNLTGVSGPASYVATYQYDNEHHLLSFNDPKSQLPFNQGSFIYDDFGRVIQERDPNAQTLESFSYTIDAKGLTATVTNANGTKTTDHYDPQGHWTTRQDGLGGTTKLSFDDQGNLLALTEANGAVSAMTYDAKGNLLTVQDPTGAVISNQYEPQRNLLVKTTLPNALGSKQYAYDSKGNLAQITDAENDTVSVTYDAAGNPASMTDGNGAVTKLTHDAAGNLVAIDDPAGARTAYTFDAVGRLTTTTDPKGAAISFSYQDNDLLTKITYPGGETYQMSYDANGNLQSETNELGKTMQYTYDGRGLIKTMTDPLGRQNQFAFDVLGRITSQTMANGASIRFGYDAMGHLVKQTDALGNNQAYQYDAVGRVIAQTDAEGHTAKFEYDGVGRQTAFVNPDGSRYTTTYDPLGRLTSVTDANGKQSTMAYDRTGLLKSHVDGEGNVWQFSYDKNGNATTVTDPEGNPLTLQYDANDHLVQTNTAEGRGISISYDTDGRLLSQTDANGNKTTFQHRWDGQISGYVFANGATASIGYDAAGRIQAITNAAGATTRYAYDDGDQLTQKTLPDGSVHQTQYDANGNVIQQSFPNGVAFQFAYDPANRLTQLTHPNGAAWKFTYDKTNRLVSEIDPNGKTWSYSYTPGGRTASITDPQGHTTKYQYDANGVLAAINDAAGGTTAFTYDSIGNLLKVQDPAGGVTQFVYNKVGSLLQMTDALGRITKIARDRTYFPTSITDALGNIRTLAFDKFGNVTETTDPSGGKFSYTYDNLDRLRTATDPTGAVTSFDYDAFGRMTKRTDPLGNVITFAYDALNRLTSMTDPAGTRTYAYDTLGRLISQTDAAGNITKFSYDANNELVTLTDPSGAVTTYAYDKNGNRVSMTDSAGHTTTFQYDEDNRLTGRTAPDGSTTRFQYDAVGNQVKIVDPTNGTSAFVYDAMNRVMNQTDASGNVTRFIYDAVGNQTQIADPAGKVTTFVYDALNQLVKTVDAQGAATAYVYDAMGRLLATTDPTGATVSNAYDAAGRLTATTDAQGDATKYTYDAGGNLTATIDPLGQSTAQSYDASGRLAATTDALSRTTKYTYDAAGNPTSVTDALGNVTQYQYDHNNRLTTIVDPLLEKTVIAYDANGNKASETDPGGHATIYQYDQNNRLTTVVDALGGRRTFIYDASGRKTGDTAPDGGTTRFVYDAGGRLTTTTDPLGNRTTRSYDSRGNLASITDPNGNATRYGYDDAGRLIQVTDAAGGVWSYAYDAAGRLLKIVDANLHNSVSFAYDLNGRLVSQTDALGNATRFGYDALGNRTKLTKPDGSALTYAYDAGNRITTIQDQAGATLATLAWDALDRMTALQSPDIAANYSYDAVGRMTRLSYPTLNQTLAFAYNADGLRTSLKVGADQTSYGYDAGHRLTSLTAPVGRGGQGVTQGAYAMSYDPAGRLHTRTYPNGVTSSYGYDLKGQITKLVHNKGDGPLLNGFAYTYDADGNRVSMTDNLGVHAYGYDKLNRLTSVTEPFGLTESFAYDPVGNRTSLIMVKKNPTSPVPPDQPASVTETISYAYDLADRLLSAGSTTYVFDAIGRLTQVRAPPDDLTAFAYDAFDRPRQITLPASKNLPPSQYAYAPQLPDLRFTPAPLGVRIKKTDSQGITQYLVDNTQNVVAELDQTGAPRKKYTQTTAIDDPLAITDEFGHTEYMLKDGLGSVSMLVDERGDPVQLYSYDAFGTPNVTAQDKNSLKFTARTYEADVRLQENRSRYFDPYVGRWITQDPLAFAAASNFYPRALLQPQRGSRCIYGENSPTINIDPLGLAVYVIGHLAASPLGYATRPPSFHTAILIRPDITPNITYTLGAQRDPCGNLVSAPNYPGDQPSHSQFAPVVVQPPDGMTDQKFISALLQANAQFNAVYKGHLPYKVPKLPSGNIQGGYNSNSYVSGIIKTAGGTPPVLPTVTGHFITPGYENPIPIPSGGTQ